MSRERERKRLQHILFGTFQSLIFYFKNGDGPIKDAHHKRKTIELWGSPQQI
jgi:hypothetical protein